MTPEEKQLLLQDLCARLPYGVKATTTSNGWNGVYTITGYVNYRIYLDCPVYDKGDDEWLVENIKPHLRSMSTMTESEMEELRELCGGIVWKKDILHDEVLDIYYRHDALDWLLKHHFDTRGLIGMGLALEAPEGMYDEMLNIQKS